MMEKNCFLDTQGRPMTQGLFLEPAYGDVAIFTLKDEDHTHKGKTYISLKKRYLEMEDVTEYEFVKEWLYSWKQWLKMCDNSMLAPHIQEWRDELEYKVRSRAARKMLEQAEAGNYQATKWILDRGWSTRGAGRPSKAEKVQHLAVEERIKDEYSDDIQRLVRVK